MILLFITFMVLSHAIASPLYFTPSELNSMLCPDGKSQCPDGSTCCKLTSGEWGCCPMLKAVCCSDGLHCCPNGTTCDVSRGKCNKGEFSMQWVKKTRSIPADSILCPDGKSQCPDGNTCCKLKTGEYGCCPLPKAVCCNDDLHCCPAGTTCDVSHGKCNSGRIGLPWLKKTNAMPAYASLTYITCPDQTECDDGQTCCELVTGKYGCCPLPKAVCCSDGLHCCPNGTTCDVSQGKCNKGDFSMPWVKKTLATPTNSILCPDGQSQCPDGSTCCKLSTGEWGCCPLPKAVCCSDGLHCCPSGTTCDVSQGKCNKGDFSMPWVKKTLATPTNSILCPDGQSQCPDGSTCCKLSTGQWGCCPLPKAACCSDGLHCCPNGTTCDVSQGKCNKGDFSMPWVKKTLATPTNSILCPDGQSQCPDGSTCCKLSTGEWGCCPLPKAVCCSDGLHCCPSGTTCDVSQGKCNKGDFSMPWVKKTLATPTNSILCPDGQSQCPDGSTCCKLSTGQWGCCPLPKAVCCSDGLHCCPSGTTCDVSQGKCNKGDFSMPWVKKTLALRNVDVISSVNDVISSVNDVISSVNDVISSVNDVTCKGGKQKCPDGNTCCEEASGLFGCCPFPDAVCCVDQQHCCPQGFTCDLQQTKCIKGSLGLPLMKKTMAQSLSTQSIVCPDQSICMDGCTCCPVSTGGFGGCPLAKAVCCADEQHCCPNGYKCSLSDGSCYLANIILPWVEHAPAVPIDKNVEVVVCPGGKQECPSQMTCCSVHRDLYGCCPVPDAVCCDDKIHCCPKDYTCKDSRCLNGDINLPMLERVSAKYTHKVESVMCPDGQSECPDGSTCCILASGQYGCCPLPKAVCCDDHQHCCPNGYKCDTAGGSCQKGDDAIPWLKKHNSIPMSGNVKCQDGSECPSGSTCCKLPTGDYGCCPYLDAVCCNDGLHCCPKGYTCNTKEGTCQKASINMLPWVKSSEGLVDLVTCPDKAKCPDKTTCCQLPSDKYACCPLEHAICCEDKIHCCPDYLTCDMPSGKCVRKSIISIPWMEKIPTLIDYVDVCPDGLTGCLSGQTCTATTSGQYNCCPMPNAVSCDGGEHCCPHGYACDKHQGCLEMDNVPLSSVQLP